MTESEEYVQTLEDECARANTLIGVLRLAAQGHVMADSDYPLYQQYLDSRERRFNVQDAESRTYVPPPGKPFPVPNPLNLNESLPVTYTEPVMNDDGFYVGFQVVHPPGVECVFPPNTKQCSCGKMDLGVVGDN